MKKPFIFGPVPFRSVLLALSTVFVALPALADDTNELQSLLSEDVITTASTTAQTASSAPATSVTITAEELRTYGIRTLAEAIDYLSVGLVTADPLRTPDMGTRGVLLPNDGGRHYLLLINGHAVNDPLYGAARFDEGAGVPLDIVDHIEVVIGPGSVLYGSSAMLGVLNVVTKGGDQYRGLHALGEYELGATYRVSLGGGTTFRLFGKDAEVAAAAEYFERFGPNLYFDEETFPFVPGRGSLQTYRRGGPADGTWGGNVKDSYFTKAPSGILQLRVGDFDVSLMTNLYRRGVPYTTESMNVDFDSPMSWEMDRALRLDVKHQAILSSFVQLRSRVYVDSFDYQRRLSRQGFDGCDHNEVPTCAYVDAGLARWAGAEEQLSLNWLDDLSLVTMLGIEGRLRKVSAKQDVINADTGAAIEPTAGPFNRFSGVLSPYLQQTWTPAAWVDLNGGVRLDVDPRFSPVFSPRGAAAFRPFEKNTTKVVYSQAFRAPAYMETDAANYRQAPNKIDPETVRSIEVSTEQRLGTQRLLAGVFYTHWDNLVEFTPLSRAQISALQTQGVLPLDAYDISQYRNVSTLENYGWNGKWDGTLASGKLSYGLSVTEGLARRHTPAGTQKLPAAPQTFGNVHVSYDFGGYLPVPGLAAHYVGPRLVDRYYSDPRYQFMPAASPFVDLRFTLSGRVPGVPGLGYRLSAAYATATRGAYVLGPSAVLASPTQTTFPLVPVDQFRFFVGLRYDFGGRESTDQGDGT